MNNSDSSKAYKPKQALAPTPQLYDELVGNGMENLAKATIAEMAPIPSGSAILDIGCGTGAGTAAIITQVGELAGLSIRGIDISEDAITMYKQRIVENEWPAEAAIEDAQKLSVPGSNYSHAIGTALLFVLPSDGIPVIREIYRTLKPGGVAALNSWAYVPNMHPVQAAAKLTRPEGTPLPRAGMNKWENSSFLQQIIHEGGFDKDKITLTKRDVYVTTTNIDRYANMLWSFIGGTSAVGWLESDEGQWEEAINIIKRELRQSDGCHELEGGRLRLKFVANIAIATK